MSNSDDKGLTYASAGVDIDAGARLVDHIKPFAASTKRPGAEPSLGGFGAAFDLKAAGYDDPILISGTDGVGTKLELAVLTGRHDTIGIDLVAMCVNDVLAQGAEPLFFLDYYATGKLDTDMAADVVSGIAEGCRQAGCALIGGETAEMPGLYDSGRYDLAGFCVGAAERSALLPRREEMAPGDALIALASSGPHSNGYSLIRKIAARAGLAWSDHAPWDRTQTLGDAMMAPTKIYVRELLGLIRDGKIKGAAHITGGGLTENTPRMLPAELAPRIDYESWRRPELFDWLAEAGGVAEEEMRRTFNCGVGMIVSVDAEEAEDIARRLDSGDVSAWICGDVVEAQA